MLHMGGTENLPECRLIEHTGVDNSLLMTSECTIHRARARLLISGRSLSGHTVEERCTTSHRDCLPGTCRREQGWLRRTLKPPCVRCLLSWGKVSHPTCIYPTVTCRLRPPGQSPGRARVFRRAAVGVRGCEADSRERLVVVPVSFCSRACLAQQRVPRPQRRARSMEVRDRVTYA